MTHITVIILSLVTLVIYIIILLLLFGIRKRLKDGIQSSVKYLTIAVFILIIIRIKDVLEKSEIFTISIPYVHESLVILLSLSLLMGIINLYKKIVWFRNHKKRVEN